MPIYSDLEKDRMLAFQKGKARLFRPLLALLTAIRISPNLVSFLSAVAAGSGLALSIQYESPSLFVAGIWLHFILDGIDGTLARYQKRESDSGELVDLIADSIGITATGIYLAMANLISPALALFFVASYLYVNTISYLLGTKGLSYRFIIRPRVFVYGALALDLVAIEPISPLIANLASLLLAYFSLTGTLLYFKK